MKSIKREGEAEKLVAANLNVVEVRRVVIEKAMKHKGFTKVSASKKPTT